MEELFQCMNWVNNVCLLLEVMNWLLWEKMLIKTVFWKVWNFFCNKFLWKQLDFKVSYSIYFPKRDGLNSCFWLIVNERDVLLDMCNETGFSLTKSLGFSWLFIIVMELCTFSWICSYILLQLCVMVWLCCVLLQLCVMVLLPATLARRRHRGGHGRRHHAFARDTGPPGAPALNQGEYQFIISTEAIIVTILGACKSIWKSPQIGKGVTISWSV